MNREKSDVGLIGLAVMGKNLALNLADQGYSVTVYNRTTAKTEGFIQEHPERGNLLGTISLKDFIASLKTPRLIILMVKAGEPVDLWIDSLLDDLEPGDVLLDGGNSHYQDTIRRLEKVESRGLYYVGAGISGGEEGARHGASIMPGGSPKAWPAIKDCLQAIAAKTPDGLPCCDWIGQGGSGHYVKMVHNGIEYGDMQLIAEIYHIMRAVLGLSYQEMQETFSNWNQGQLNSFLIEITGTILGKLDTDGEPLLEKILDSAEQKGTGRWTAISSLELGVPLSMIIEAVQSRTLSSLKEQRVLAADRMPGPEDKLLLNGSDWLDYCEQALYAAKMISYAQGFDLLRAASKEYRWNLDLGRIALLWREGCIIRSVFLERIHAAYQEDPNLQNLMVCEFFLNELRRSMGALRQTVTLAVNSGVPVPGLSSALAYYDGYRTKRLPSNLIQAQRDFFGAHRYERIDSPRGNFFHTDWTAP